MLVPSLPLLNFDSLGGGGGLESKNMDHWWYLFSQKLERKISAFLEAKIRAYLLP